MFNKSILEFVRILAQKDENFPSTLMTKIWAEADKANEVSLMADIALRSDMPQEIIQKAKAKKDIPIKIAYLSRKNISVEELREALANENRAGVLSGVFENIDSDVAKANIDIFSEHFKKKPTKALAEALLTKTDALDDDLAALVVSELAPKERSLTDDQSRAYRRLLAKAIKSKNYLNQVVTTLSDETLEANAVEFIRISSDSDVVLERAVETMVSRYLNELRKLEINPNGNNNYLRRMCYTISRNIETLLQENNLLLGEKIIKVIEGFNFPDEEVNASIKSYIERFSKYKNGDIQGEIELASTGGPEMLIDLLSRVDKRATVLSENAILAYVAINPNSDAIINRLMDYSDRFTQEELYHKVKGKASQKFFTNLYLARFDDMVKIDEWKSFGDEANGTKTLVKCFTEDYFTNDSSNSYHASYRIRSAGYDLVDYIKDVDTLKALPWSFLTELLQTSYYYNDRIKKVSNIVANTLDSFNTSGGSWDTFGVIAEGFQGTLAELELTSLNI